MGEEFEEIETLFEELNKSKEILFPVQGEKLLAPKEKGVYIISNDEKTILHVGNTPRAKNGIEQRLKNHMSGASSFSRKYLAQSGQKLRGECFFRYLVIDTASEDRFLQQNKARQRALLECYAIGRLCPKHLGTSSAKINIDAFNHTSDSHSAK